MSGIKWTTQENGSYAGVSSSNRHLNASAGAGTNSVSSFLYEFVENCDNTEVTVEVEGPTAEYHLNASGGWYNSGKGVGKRGGEKQIFT